MRGLRYSALGFTAACFVGAGYCVADEAQFVKARGGVGYRLLAHWRALETQHQAHLSKTLRAECRFVLSPTPANTQVPQLSEGVFLYCGTLSPAEELAPRMKLDGFLFPSETTDLRDVSRSLSEALRARGHEDVDAYSVFVRLNRGRTESPPSFRTTIGTGEGDRQEVVIIQVTHLHHTFYILLGVVPSGDAALIQQVKRQMAKISFDL